MFRIKENYTIKNTNINVEIDSNEEILDGGVYMFLIDEIPLYIGETNLFLSRLSEHLYKMNKGNDSYFGLEKLEGNHKITYKILENGLPYIKKENKENKKQYYDANKSRREKKQNEYIREFYPLLQYPIIYEGKEEELEKSRKKKTDSMINRNIKDQVVHEILKSHKKSYKEIIKKYEEVLENMKKKDCTC